MLGLACWSHGGGGGVDVGQAGGVVNYHSDQASFATNFKIVGGGRQLSVCKGRCPGSKHYVFYKVYIGRGVVKPVYKNFAANLVCCESLLATWNLNEKGLLRHKWCNLRETLVQMHFVY